MSPTPLGGSFSVIPFLGLVGHGGLNIPGLIALGLLIGAVLIYYRLKKKLPQKLVQLFP